MTTENLFLATYSNLDVYECYIDEIPIMRRCSDNWVNATQILKAAKFPKAHRTRILEREVQKGTHEKIQGGYGRFQGTWIPLDIARPLAHKYNISDKMAPILSYVPDPNNPLPKRAKVKPLPSTSSQQTNGSDLESPLKKPKRTYNTKKKKAEAAAAAERVRLEEQQRSFSEAQNLAPSQDEIFWQQPKQAQSHLQHGELSQPNFLPQQFSQVHQQSSFNFQHAPQLHHQQSFQQLQQQQQQQQQQQAYRYQQHQHQQQQQHQPQQQIISQPQFYQPQEYQQHRPSGSGGNENWSQDDGSLSTQMDEVMRDSDTSISSGQSSPNHSDTKNAKAIYTENLIQFFSNETDEVPQVLYHPPNDFDFNEQIDEEGHTSLHWASAMANVPLIELLLKFGSDPLSPNSTGLNCISRAIFFNNSFQKNNFHKLVDLMKNCLYTPDKSGRTPIHYICESIKTKYDTSKYYLEIILNKLSEGNENLLRIVVNHKDFKGNSALDLAHYSNNPELVELLTRYGAISASTEQEPIEDIQDNANDNANDTVSFIKEDSSFIKDEESADVPIPPVPSLPLQEVGPIFTSMLSSLADAYDNELKAKEEENGHTKTILQDLETDIKSTEAKNDMVLAQIDNGSSLEELLNNIEQLEKVCEKKTQHLNKIIERSQALSLAKLVHKEESSISLINNNSNEFDLALDLTHLQFNRKHIVEKILEELTKQSINSKMNNYRRLISISCDLKVEHIDELIDEIEIDLTSTAQRA